MKLERIEELIGWCDEFVISLPANKLTGKVGKNFRDIISILSDHKKSRPLIDAVMGAEERDLRVEYMGRMTAGSFCVLREAANLRTALKYREGSRP